MADAANIMLAEALDQDHSIEASRDFVEPVRNRVGAGSRFTFSGPEEVHVWSFGLEPPLAEVERLGQFLSAQERERADRFRFEHHRLRYITAHGVLREILGCYLSMGPGEIDFDAGPRGKPFLRQAGLQFNLAHSDRQGLIAISSQSRVGVDLELVRSLPDAGELVARFFSRRETLQFFALPEEQRSLAFFNLWTRKEAWLKATGEGIAHLLAEVEVAFLPEEEPDLLALPMQWGALRTAWSLRSMVPAPGFVGALAVERQNARPLLRPWNTPEKETSECHE